MDKTVEVIVVAMIALVVAMILIFMVRGQSDGFLDFANSQATNAECDVIDASGQDVPPECVDSGDGGGDFDDETNPVNDCSSISKEKNCRPAPTCEWVAGQCEPK